jgi:AraC-like DNA-binding protein
MGRQAGKRSKRRGVCPFVLKKGTVDPLDDVFAAMRVRSAAYARFEATSPWGITFAGGTTARFGLVVRGGCWLSVEGLDPVALATGDCYVLVRGSTYALRDKLGSPTRNCFEVVGANVGSVIDIGGGGGAATVITGWFTFDAVSSRPLIDLMPLVLHAKMDERRTQVMASTLTLLDMETAGPGLGSEVVISRLADILFIQAIRAHIAATGEAATGWLAALSDPRIGPALRAIHDDAARAWTVEALAATAGMSRSAFAASFKERIGEPPLEYLTRWRMFRGGALLQHSDQTLSRIASAVGYDSEAAFSKAFKRLNGLSPGSYRRIAAKPATGSVAPVAM